MRDCDFFLALAGDYGLDAKFFAEAKFEESKHPRADDGKFGEGAGDSNTGKSSDQDSEAKRDTPYGSISVVRAEAHEYKRFSTDPDDPLSDWGHAMFVRDDAVGDDQMGVYGDNKYEIKEGTELASPEDIKEAVNKIAEEYGLPRDITDDDDALDPEELIDVLIERLNPGDIVDSADGWDSKTTVRWFSEVFYPNTGIQGISTEDGAVVFDPEAIEAVK